MCALQSRSRRGGPQVTARDTNTERAPGTGVMPRPMPVPAPPPGLTDVLQRSARLGLGALGLASRAAGSLFARVPDGSAAEQAEPAGPLALLPGAVLGLAIEAERRAATVVDAVAERTAGVGRRAARPAIVQRALRPVEDALLALERGRAPRTDPEPGAGGGAHPGDRAAGHGERDRADRLRARGRADPGRRHRRRDRRRGDRRSASTSAASSASPRWASRPRRSTQCARGGSISMERSRVWSTDSCSGARERDVRRWGRRESRADPPPTVTRGARKRAGFVRRPSPWHSIS